MATDAEMRSVLAEVLKVWEMFPELRLTQLIVNATERNDPFHVTDADLVESIQAYPEKAERAAENEAKFLARAEELAGEPMSVDDENVGVTDILEDFLKQKDAREKLEEAFKEGMDENGLVPMLVIRLLTSREAQDLLEMAGVYADIPAIESWSDDELRQALSWAYANCMNDRGSDLKVPDKPSCVRGYMIL